MQMAVVTLKNGVRVANYFEEQPIVFDTGDVLPACNPSWLLDAQACRKEVEYDYQPWTDIEIKTYLATSVRQYFFRMDWEEVDIVLVPEHVRRAIVEEYKRFSNHSPAWLDAAYKKTRMALRAGSDGAICSTKFLM